ncbi:MAG: haloalkane dehalogenase [Chloroflexota bacterium]
MQVLRTPEERFHNLKDYPFEPNYVEIEHTDGSKLRFHYLDEGEPNGEVILCLHGQPSWSYLYRKMIPLLTAGGHRVIAPDMIGFGKSDKPTERDDYTYSNHTAWVKAFIEALDLQNITLICQDWGAMIGLRIVGLYPDRFARVVAANAPLVNSKMLKPEIVAMAGQFYPTMPVPSTEDLKNAFRNYGPTTFLTWIKYCAESPDFSVRSVMEFSLYKPTEAELDAYEAPFPDESYAMGARMFPKRVPILPESAAELLINDKAWEGLMQFDKPFITAFATHDNVTKGGEKAFKKYVPGAQGQKHTIIKGGHFVQDDNAEELSAITLAFMADNPL